MADLQSEQSREAGPTTTLLRDPETVAAVVALSKVRTRNLALPEKLHRAHLEHTWHSRKKINAGWMLWAAALNIICTLFSPFIVPLEAVHEVVLGRVAITAILVAGAAVSFTLRRPGLEGWATIAVCMSIIAVVGWMTLHVSPHLAERYIVHAVFMCGTAIVIARIRWHETIRLTMLVVLALSLLMATTASDSFSLAEKLQMMIFFDVGLVGLALARQAMNKLQHRVFILGLVDQLKMAEIEEMNGRLHAIARTDPLTAVMNRRGFDEAFAALASRPESETRVALFMIDIDFFKRLNDGLGHAAGDECLRIVAGLISSELRHGQDLLARFGGEEFVALLPGVTGDEAVAAAERVRRAVERRAIPNPDADGGVVTVSVGVAVSPPASVSRLVARADAALYEAKSSGRNAVRLAAPPAALRIA